MPPGTEPGKETKTTMKNLFWAAGSVIVAVVIALLLGSGGVKFGAVTSPATNLDYLQLSQGLSLPAGPSVSTTVQGTNLQALLAGNCIIHAYATTIAATSTATVDCQAGASALTAIPTIAVGDNVFVHATSSWPTTSGGLVIESSQASTTAGYITMTISNLTGATYTWTNTASTSIQYWATRY